MYVCVIQTVAECSASTLSVTLEKSRIHQKVDVVDFAEKVVEIFFCYFCFWTSYIWLLTVLFITTHVKHKVSDDNKTYNNYS